MGRNPNALVLGELRSEHAQGARTLGGSAVHFACFFAALGHDVQLAARVMGSEEGARDIDLLQAIGVDTTLLQREGIGSFFHAPTSEVPHMDSDDILELAVSPGLLSSGLEADIVFFSSFTQGGSVSGDTLTKFLSHNGPSFKIYDIHCGKRLPIREHLEEGLSVASVAHVRGCDIPILCDLLGLPHLEPGLLAPALTERFGVSYCVVTEPREGALVSSIVGEQIGVDSVQKDLISTRGWHEAFLAAFTHHVFCGSPLSRCCVAGMRYGDFIASRTDVLGVVPPEVVEFVHELD